jgi:carbonic anhydrase
MEKIPHTRKWLELALPVKEKVLKILPETDHAAREWLTEQINVIEQLGHLLTYPYIKERVEDGSIRIFGWHYIIHTGDIYQYDNELEQFELLST